MYRYLIIFLLLVLALPLNSAERIRGHYAVVGKVPKAHTVEKVVFEEFMNFYRTHSQVNQAVVDYAKKTVYKDVEAQLTEMPRRNPKTGEPMGPEAQKLYSMRRPSIGRARGSYKPRDVDTAAIVQGAIANLLRDNHDVTLSVSAEDAAAIQNDPNIDKAIKDRLITPKQ